LIARKILNVFSEVTRVNYKMIISSILTFVIYFMSIALLRNYFDETSGQCNKAMDKVIELYKENEHGTELVKDIEKVLSLQTKDDELTPSPRAKEYLKRCMELVKGK
jgi:hypothetical protein